MWISGVDVHIMTFTSLNLFKRIYIYQSQTSI